MQVPEHIKAVYAAIESGGDGALAELFSSTTDEQHIMDMYHEVVALQLTMPLLSSIAGWIATGIKPGDEIDPEEIPSAITTLISIIIAQLHGVMKEDDGAYIKKVAAAVARNMNDGGEE